MISVKTVNNVIDAFHIVNGKSIPRPFFIDERKQNRGIRLTENYYNLLELKESENFFNFSGIEEIGAMIEILDSFKYL